jgi:hypothetical protein
MANNVRYVAWWSVPASQRLLTRRAPQENVSIWRMPVPTGLSRSGYERVGRG